MYFYCVIVFVFNDTATTEIYTLSLHDALPIFRARTETTTEVMSDGTPDTSTIEIGRPLAGRRNSLARKLPIESDRKSTRLNSSHANISYAVFCLKKKSMYNQFTNHHTTYLLPA